MKPCQPLYDITMSKTEAILLLQLLASDVARTCSFRAGDPAYAEKLWDEMIGERLTFGAWIADAIHENRYWDYLVRQELSKRQATLPAHIHERYRDTNDQATTN